MLNDARVEHKNTVQARIDEAGQMKDLVDVTKALFELSRETAHIEAEAFALKQQVAVAQEVKSTLDSWVRHEANLREREQKQLAAYLIEKVKKDLEDPAIQKQILDQAVADVESKLIRLGRGTKSGKEREMDEMNDGTTILCYLLLPF